MFDRNQIDLGMNYLKVAKKVLHYLQGTKHYILTFKKLNNLDVIGYSDSDFFGCVDRKKIHIRLHIHACRRTNFMKEC
jgi:hypothetical protein